MKGMDFLHIAVRNLLRSKLRTIFNALIITLGVVILVLTFSLSDRITAMSHEHILETKPMREITMSEDLFSPGSRQIDYRVIEEIKGIEHVSEVYPDNQVIAGFYNGDEWLGVGVIHGYPEMGLPQIIKGAAYIDGDKNVAVIPDKLSVVEGVANGEEFIGQKLLIEYTIGEADKQEIGIYEVEVVGIYDTKVKNIAPNSIFVPVLELEDIRATQENLTIENYYRFTTFQDVMILVDQEEYVQEVAEEIEAMGFSTYYLAKELESMPGAVKMIILIGLSITVIVLLSGAISIGLTMVQATKQRMKEIGLMKAVGYSNRDISSIFLIEALLIGLFGGIFGLIIAAISLAGLEKFLASTNQLPFFSLHISAMGVFLALFISLLVTLMGSIIPTMQAAKMNPSLTLRSE